MTLDEWFALARENAARRNLPELPPLLDSLRSAARQLRDADWNVSMTPALSGRDTADSKPSEHQR